jgi:hypothetical protein
MATKQTQFNDFTLPIDGYAAFDALSLKGLIINRLNGTGILTDQNFEGSNLSSIIDIVAYAYHVLLFYLNRTGAEATFTTAELYENINKIVKLIGYKPIGDQTAILPFQSTASKLLAAGTYTIPRYSYFTINGTKYSFNKDITFAKTTNDTEVLTNLQDNNVLYQGGYTEYPTYAANGSPFEILTMALVSPKGQNVIIDHFNIDVYVKDNTATTPSWVQWAASQSLFLERPTATKYEIRLNENGRYEIKFGNNVNGKQLNPGDEVAVYYIQSDGTKGEVGPGLLDTNNKFFFFNTPRFASIQTDTTPANLQLITLTQTSALTFKNNDPSTVYAARESVDSIKSNASNTFKSQYRLITADDFITFINKNYNNIISSTQVVNNWDYIQGHLKYYFDLGVTAPNNESRVLFNQVKFADSTNFNNVYVYAVPKLKKTTSLSTRTNYLNAVQKQLILNDLQATKLTTTEVIINDPVYVEVDLGTQTSSTQPDPALISNSTQLVITRSITARRSPQAISQLVASIFQEYFATTKDNLGALISTTELSNQILQLGDIEKIETITTVGNDTYTVPGISLIAYNPIYPYNDYSVISQDTQLPYFKFPYLKDSAIFIQKIAVITPSIQTLT